MRRINIESGESVLDDEDDDEDVGHADDSSNRSTHNNSAVVSSNEGDGSARAAASFAWMYAQEAPLAERIDNVLVVALW